MIIAFYWLTININVQSKDTIFYSNRGSDLGSDVQILVRTFGFSSLFLNVRTNVRTSERRFGFGQVLRLGLGSALFDADAGAVGSGAISSSAVVDSTVGVGGGGGVDVVGAGAARVVVGVVIGVVMLVLSLLQ